MVEPSARTQQTYDEVAAVYAQKTAKTYPQLMDDLAALTSGLLSGSVIADIGCGPGRDVTLLRRYGFTVVGFDLSHGQLAAGGLSGLVQADMRRLPLGDQSLDAIWCQAALLHVPHEAVSDVLAEFARVTESGGRLNLVVAEGDGQGWESARGYGTESPRWFAFHREPALTGQLAAAGFRTHQVRRERSGRDWLAFRAERMSSS